MCQSLGEQHGGRLDPQRDGLSQGVPRRPGPRRLATHARWMQPSWSPAVSLGVAQVAEEGVELRQDDPGAGDDLAAQRRRLDARVAADEQLAPRRSPRPS
ncbi:hypothetical protein ACFSTC_51070 [Nonomuraea ferruginea]